MFPTHARWGTSSPGRSSLTAAGMMRAGNESPQHSGAGQHDHHRRCAALKRWNRHAVVAHREQVEHVRIGGIVHTLDVTVHEGKLTKARVPAAEPAVALGGVAAAV